MTSVCSCEKYDPVMDKWTKIASMSDRRAGAGVTSLNGCLYAVGNVFFFTTPNTVSYFHKYNPLFIHHFYK